MTNILHILFLIYLIQWFTIVVALIVKYGLIDGVEINTYQDFKVDPVPSSVLPEECRMFVEPFEYEQFICPSSIADRSRHRAGRS